MPRPVHASRARRRDSIAQVFLLPVADRQRTGRVRTPAAIRTELAVVNLTGAFAASHPSGLETETLTILSICATLHANLPRVTEVRFLVDGQRARHAGRPRRPDAHLSCRRNAPTD